MIPGLSTGAGSSLNANDTLSSAAHQGVSVSGIGGIYGSNVPGARALGKGDIRGLAAVGVLVVLGGVAFYVLKRRK